MGFVFAWPRSSERTEAYQRRILLDLYLLGHDLYNLCTLSTGVRQPSHRVFRILTVFTKGTSEGEKKKPNKVTVERHCGKTDTTFRTCLQLYEVDNSTQNTGGPALKSAGPQFHIYGFN